MRKFKEFVEAKDLQEATPLDAKMKTGVMDTLMAAQKAPAPAGANPQMFQAKLRQAQRMAQTVPVKSAGAAVDAVNAQNNALKQ